MQRPEMSNTSSEIPAMLAAIDIGSNTIRMVIAQVLPDGKLDILERLWRAVRLGQDTFRAGRLRGETMRSAISTLRDYRYVLSTYGVGRVRAVATSAVREAANGDTFIDRILMATGLQVSIIGVAEESRLTISAVRQATGEKLLQKNDSLIVEVGGGSTTVNLLRDGAIAAWQSLPIGSVRMQEVLSTGTEPANQAARLIERQVSSAIATFKGILPLKNVDKFVAIGGDARWAAGQVGRPFGETPLRVISRNGLDELLATCESYTADELARTHHLPFTEAETIVPALLVYSTLLKATGVREMIVSDVSMRDGLLLDMAVGGVGRDTETMYKGTIQSAEAIAQKYLTDMAHARYIRMAAVRIFDALSSEHRLGDRHRMLLEVAAQLHEIGTFVSSRAHHKHTRYLISSSEIPGLTQDELLMVANVARYHRRSRPKPSHIEYMALPHERRMVVNRLAAILRLADALDVSRTQQLTDFHCRIDKNGFIISVNAGGDLILERRALADKADMFQDIYGLDVRLEEIRGPWSDGGKTSRTMR